MDFIKIDGFIQTKGWSIQDAELLAKLDFTLRFSYVCQIFINEYFFGACFNFGIFCILNQDHISEMCCEQNYIIRLRVPEFISIFT